MLRIFANVRTSSAQYAVNVVMTRGRTRGPDHHDGNGGKGGEENEAFGLLNVAVSNETIK
jgi:hypothetical protein